MSAGLRLPKHLAWGAVVQRLVWALVIVEHEPRADTATCLGNRTIRLDEHFFVLQAAPQPFNEDVIEEPALAIHAHAYTMTFQLIEKRSTGELYALIGVEHLRLAKALHRLLQRFHTEIGVHTNRQLPSQHPAAEPIHHSHQIDESLGHRDISDIRAPHLIRPFNRHSPQQVRIDFVFWMPATGVRLLASIPITRIS